LLATDPEVLIAEVRGFGDGGRVCTSLRLVRARALVLVGAEEGPEGEASSVAALIPLGRAITLAEVGHIGRFLASEQALPPALRVLREGFGSRS
jgi:hypothetical protein